MLFQIWHVRVVIKKVLIHWETKMGIIDVIALGTESDEISTYTITLANR